MVHLRRNCPVYARRRLRGTGMALCVLAGAFAPGSGCQTSIKQEGASRTAAAYSFGTLEADLPQSVRVPAVLGAADAALRRRGYSVPSGAATEDRGEVRGEPSAQSDASSVRVNAWIVPGATRVGVKVGWVGDETLSRAILDEVLQRLGL